MSKTLSPETIKKLKEIKAHFDAAQSLFNEINAKDNSVILDYHNAEYSLNHCVRWGVSACDELLE